MAFTRAHFGPSAIAARNVYFDQEYHLLMALLIIYGHLHRCCIALITMYCYTHCLITRSRRRGNVLPVEELDPGAEIGPDVVVDPDVVDELVAAAVLHDHLQHAVRQHERRGDIRHRQLLPDCDTDLRSICQITGTEAGMNPVCWRHSLACCHAMSGIPYRSFLVLFGCG